MIETGTADVTVNGTRLREVGPGDAVSEVAVLASGRRTAPVRAFAWLKRDVWGLEHDAPESPRFGGCLQ